MFTHARIFRFNACALDTCVRVSDRTVDDESGRYIPGKEVHREWTHSIDHCSTLGPTH